MENFLKDFKQSKNKIYFFIKYNGLFSAFFASMTLIVGSIGFFKLEDEHNLLIHIINAVFNSVSLFGLNLPTGAKLNFFTFIASVSAIITIALTAVLFFFKEQINKKMFNHIGTKKHIGVFGLGDIARTLLDSEDFDMSAVIIEKNDRYVEEYRSKGFGVKTGDAFNEDFLQKNINFQNMEYAIVSFGEDKKNIEFIKKLVTIYKDRKIKSKIKLIVHIKDKNLTAIFNKSFINSQKKIHIKTFSYYEECARNLFDTYNIDGDNFRYIEKNSQKTLQTFLMGDGELLQRVIYNIFVLSHFPNENKHIVTIIDPNADKILHRIKTYTYYDEYKFPTIKLQAKKVDFDAQEFYDDTIWKEVEGLENIILCYDDENKNISLGTSIQERVYLSDAIDGNKIPKILMGVFTELEFGDSINKNNEEYKNLYTFGSKKEIVNKKYLLDEEIDYVAKLIRYGYNETYNPNAKMDKTTQTLIDEKWYEKTSFTDKLSNLSQAKHIDLKLKAMGLQKQKKEENQNELLKENRKIIDEILSHEVQKNIHTIVKSKDNKCWTDSFDDNLFTKLVRSEHNRWNAYHFVNGWDYSEEKNKTKKEHDCLLPISKFNKTQRETVIYDCYAILYIPNYLAQSGYEIVKYKSEKVK